jgi:hypothetical protein
MKEPITKFDLEAAFKALDEIDIPVTGKVKANKPALTEIFSRKSKFDTLMEEYYDISDMSELDDAKEAREAEVAQAKLARIEKIVDLDAESPEDLLPSYVGKFIMQCPQCMTLFYKDPEDVEKSEEDPDTVNVNEVCQHCGNDAGYTLIGKVGEATAEETADYNEEEAVDVTSTEEGEEENLEELPDEPVEDAGEDIDLDVDLDALDLDIEEEEEKKEEGFNAGNGEQVLVEQLTEEADLDVSADEFEKLISSPEFKKPISDNEARTMMDELSDEKEEVKESALTEATLDPDSFLADGIYDLFNTGKFTYLPRGNKPPKTEKLSDDTYRITHPKGGASVTVKFNIEDDKHSTLIFKVKTKDGDKDYTTNNTGEAQDFILKELEAAYIKQFDVDLDESVNVNNENLKYAVINPDGTYAGVPCTSYEEAKELAAQKEGRVVVELRALTEGILDKLKDKFADTLDKIDGKLKSREAKANWVLANAMKDYNDIEVGTDGQLVPDKNNQRFKTFVVIGYTSRDSRGELIKAAPDFDDQTLVVGKNGVQPKDNYADADKIAKGWSMVQGNGPAFIYLAKDKEDDNALFLCEYFMGTLKNDQLEKYFKVVKNHLKGAKLMAAGGIDSEEVTSEEPMKNTAAEDEYHGKYLRDNLNTVMEDVEELQEASLEKLISDSLVEAYGNVAGFRLTECSHADNMLTVNGTIYFTSGNKRKTNYVFSEAFISEDGKVSIRGLNEKLGLDKQFIMTGRTNNKTFITESFNYIKN